MTPSIIAVTPSHPYGCDPGLAIAAVRAGEIGLLDLGPGTTEADRRRAVEQLARFADRRETWGIRWDASSGDLIESLARLGSGPWPYLLIAGLGSDHPHEGLRGLLTQAREMARMVLLEVYDAAGALAARELPVDGLLIKSNEAGGRVGPDSAFMLLQKLHGRLRLPFWIQGAWGPDTAAAAYLAGATGVVLCEELWLARESPLSNEDRRRIERLDGSESVCIGDQRALFRLFKRFDRNGLAELERGLSAGAVWPEPLYERWRATESGDGSVAPRPMGQGVAFAARLARRHPTAGGILQAFRRTVTDHLSRVGEQRSLAEDGPLARDIGTRYPILQGPMTRVSDVASFCGSVANNGALPFLALALMRGGEARLLLEQTRQELGDRPWGVGILGFVPPELRKEQIEAVEACRPRFALIAGGRPSQATGLEERGIATYLHVPSPGLLTSFLEEGARRFVLEGRECGGHVGPRSSFLLWQSAIDVLLETEVEGRDKIHVVFAGGIHDALSSALVQTLAVGLVEHGIKVGVLMGTAYLFTDEAVDCGAITSGYQSQAVACAETTLLESGVGHATRCAKTPFTEEFAEQRRQLEARGLSPASIRFELEMLNVGRLRLASKGLMRLPAADDVPATPTDRPEDGASPSAAELLARGAERLKGRMTAVDGETQRREGMYMIGEVATLRKRSVSMAALHHDVSVAGCATATRLAARRLPSSEREPAREPGEPIAIIGMACVFPDSPDLRVYWQNILNRFDAVREVPHERWRPDLYYSPDRLERDKLYSKWGSFLGDYRFDPLKYRIPPASVASIDPVQLMLLDVAQAALTDAGYGGERPFPRERTAVIVGSGGINDVGIDYAMRTMLPHYFGRIGMEQDETHLKTIERLREELPEWTEDSFPGVLVNVYSGRLANRLDLQGPNFVIDAACASSLAALHTAVEQLRSRTSDMALVGAADGTNSAFAFMSFAKTHALTPSGRIRPFDERADGIVLGEGVGVLILKRLSDAERDGDTIRAVIRGVGCSSDGRNRSLTAPHPEGQALAFERAYADAGVEAGTITLIEGHATGTAVGDHSELAAMRRVFGDAPEPYCAVGSVKSNIGHAKTAAGMAALIKTTLALQHRVLPPTINVEQPNQRADFEHSPFWINVHSRPWIDGKKQHPRRAGVSAFGFGGTNFHVVLEEYRSGYGSGPVVDLNPRPAEVFLWQRPDRATLVAALQQLSDGLTEANGARIDQLACCLHHEETERAGQGVDRVRLGLVATSVDDLRAKLALAVGAARGDVLPQNAGIYLSDAPSADPTQICLLFPGQGSQRIDMLADLAQYGPLGLGLYEEADRLLADLLPRPLSSYIFPRPVFDKEGEKRVRDELDDTRVAQPALGVTNLFASDVLGRFGIKPAFTAGHSYGEYVALCVAGGSSRHDLLRLSALRGRAVHEAGKDHPGGMAAVAASAEETQTALDELGIDAIIANFNGPRQMVIAGSPAAIATARKKFPERGLAIRRIAVTAAFHTEAMEQPSKAFGEYLQEIELSAPRIPLYSNVTAAPYPLEVEALRRLLAIHLARPVRFVQQIEAMYRDGARIFIETGPGRVLTGLVSRILEGRPHETLALDTPGQHGWQSLGHLLARAHALGLKLDLDPCFERRGLESRPTVDYLRAARERALGRPTDWILNPRGARPATEARTPREAPATTGRPRSTMSDDPAFPRPSPPGDPTRTSLLCQLQETMNKWLEIQQEQQRLNERFLEIQERIVCGFLDGQDRAPAEALLAALPTGRPDRSVGLAVAPAPVLPNLLPTKGAAPAGPQTAAEPSIPPEPLDDETSLPTIREFARDLLAEVSGRTGYPEEMLELDLPLEAGLGVDSIKTMEIFSALKRYHRILSEQDQDEEDLLVALAQLKTLQDIINQYAKRRSELAARGDEPQKSVADRPEDEPSRPMTASAPAVERLIVRPLPAPVSPRASTSIGLDFPSDQILLIVGDAPELQESMEAAMATIGHRVLQLVPGQRTKRLSAQRYEVDLLDVEALRTLAGEIKAKDGARVGGLINLLPLGEAFRQPGLNGKKTPLRLVQALMNVAQVFEEDIRGSGERGGGILVNVTTLDGRFGLRGDHALPIAQAGSLGVFKSLAREWRGVRVKNVDLDPNADPKLLLVSLLQELAAEDNLTEVGLDDEGRWRLALIHEPLGNGTHPPDEPRTDLVLPLSKDAVVLATGGAFGITADVVRRLARESGARFVIVGRTTLDAATEETAELRAIDDVVTLRNRLIQLMRADRGDVTPGEVEKRLQQILKRRTIRTNLETLRGLAASVEYHAIDVRDDEAFGVLIDDLYERFGRIDGVLHGAGIIEDRWLRDKTAESVARVFETKVNGALLLAKKLRPETLRFFVMFSSVSGRFGNVGQTDYSAANEVLNKLAGHLNREWSARVVAINWGPWDSGMITDGLRSAYASRGIELISPEAGVSSLLEELCLEQGRESEVVLTCSAERIAQLGETHG